MGEWKTGRIGDFFELVNGYAFKSKEFKDTGVPVIKIKNVKAGEFSKHEFSYVDATHLTERANKIALKNDLLISMSGNRHDGSPETWVGKVCRFSEDNPYLINQRVGALRLKKVRRADRRFFGFLLSGKPYQETFIAIATSSGGQANLSPTQILSAPVRYPELVIQRRIGEILGSLDDKIYLNRRTNETLEAMARTIFKDWFVDFGPTRAKAEGRAPYLAPELWELFPDKLDDEGTPEGWETKPLKDCLERLKVGKLYDQKSVLPTGRVPVLDQGKSGIIGFHDNEANIQASPKRRVSVFANHTCLQRLLDFNFSTIQNVIPFVGRQLPTEWVHYASLGKQNFEEYRGHWPSFIVHSVIVPTTELASTYVQLVDPLLLKISVNQTQGKTLTQIRDFLLPKLMSGKIRLSEAKKTVEAVA